MVPGSALWTFSKAYNLIEKDPAYLQAAERYFDVACECFTGVRKTQPKTRPENCPMKALSPVMIMAVLDVDGALERYAC